MRVDFLGTNIELNEYTIGQDDAIQNALLGDSNLMGNNGENVSVSMSAFKASQYLAIEYGTKDESITVDYIKNLPRSKANDVNDLYDAIVLFNGDESVTPKTKTKEV